MMDEHRFYHLPALPGLELRHGRGGCIAYGMHAHEQYSVGLILSGRTAYQCENRCYRAQTGDAMVLPPQTPHACNPAQGYWHYLMVYVEADYWQQTVGRDDFAAAPLRDRGLCRALLALLRGARREDAVLMAQAWRAAAACLQRQAGRGAAYSAEWRTCVADLPDNPVAAASERRWRRVLAASGMGPHQWRLNRRINRARQWLRQGLPLAEVAYRLGFADQAHFQRLFRQHTAVTPGHYRRAGARSKEHEHGAEQ